MHNARNHYKIKMKMKKDNLSELFMLFFSI